MFKVGGYLRLSRDDGDKEVSDSIENQKTLLNEFVKKHPDMIAVNFYVDDGYSGLNFERPAFIRMMADVYKGKINTIITKDMSRLGREHIETSHYIEKVFPLNHIRYIAILDNYDSLTGSNVEIAPFKSLLNDMYAKDISKKVRSAFQSKLTRGEFIGAFSPYGYQKHPDNNDLLIIDEYAAAVVKRIFDLYIKGVSMMAIANLLNKETVPCPLEYKKQRGEQYKTKNRPESVLAWNYPAINRILHNEIYTGNMVQRKSEMISYKLPKRRRIPKEDWMIVEGTHEPIVDKTTYHMVQKIILSKNRSLQQEEPLTGRNVTIFAGILKCGDCGRALTKCTSTIYKEKKRNYYKCSTYRTYGKKACTLHTIREDVLTNIILQAIKTEAQKSLTDTDVEELKLLSEKLQASEAGTIDRKAFLLKLAKADQYLSQAYEDYVDKLLSKEEYILFKGKYTREKEQITAKLAELEDIQLERSEALSYDKKWLEKFVDYSDIDTLTREVIVELIDCIKVYEGKKLEIEFKFKPN